MSKSIAIEPGLLELLQKKGSRGPVFFETQCTIQRRRRLKSTWDRKLPFSDKHSKFFDKKVMSSLNVDFAPKFLRNGFSGFQHQILHFWTTVFLTKKFFLTIFREPKI